MAVYRNIQIDYWQDGFVLDLTPEEKYFYIYLMTNSKTTQCGIYELPMRIIETETGYNRETVMKLIHRFVDYNKIVYCDDSKEIFLVNWIKHNKIVSPKVRKCIEKQLKDVKSDELVKLFLLQCKRYGYFIEGYGEFFEGISSDDKGVDNVSDGKAKEDVTGDINSYVGNKSATYSGDVVNKSKGDYGYGKFKCESVKSKYAKSFKGEDEGIYRRPSEKELEQVRKRFEC